MMIIVRVLPLGSKDELWRKLSETVPKLEFEDARPLFLSQHEEYDHVTIVFDAQSFDAIVPLFCDHLAKCGPVLRTKTAPLLRPVFFPVPKERPANLNRYRLAMKVHTPNMKGVYRKLSTLTYPPDVFPTYQAYSFGEDDIFVSILAPSREMAEDAVRFKIEGLEGIIDTELTYVKRNLRIASGGEWRRYRESFYVSPPSESSDVEFDWLDAAMSGAFVDEF
jgi:hypothetical protein